MSSSLRETDAGTVLCALICLLPPALAILAAILSTKGSRRRHREQAAAAWQQLLVIEQQSPGAHRCHVAHVYQRARRGAKVVIVWTATGTRQDTWFWGFWPAPGSTLLVRGASGYGPHNHNPSVFYVEPGGVLAGAPPGAYHAWTARAAGQ